MAFESFHYELQELADQSGQLTTTIYCHGKLITENTADIRALVSPIIARGGRIILDFSDLEYLASSALAPSLPSRFLPSTALIANSNWLTSSPAFKSC